MQDEVSETMRVAITVWMMAGLLGIVMGIFVLCTNVLTNYVNTYGEAADASSSSSVVSVSSKNAKPGAVLYSSICDAEGEIDAVLIGSTYIYKYNDTKCQKLMCLLTTNKNKVYSVQVEQGRLNPMMKTVILTEVK